VAMAAICRSRAMSAGRAIGACRIVAISSGSATNTGALVGRPIADRDGRGWPSGRWDRAGIRVRRVRDPRLCTVQERLGCGYATEALGGVIQMAGQIGLRFLRARCHPFHVTSQRVLEKNTLSAKKSRAWPIFRTYPTANRAKPCTTRANCLGTAHPARHTLGAGFIKDLLTIRWHPWAAHGSVYGSIPSAYDYAPAR